MLVQSEIGDQRLQLAVLFAQLPELSQFAQTKTRIASLPAVKSLRRNAQLAANIAYLLAPFGLPQSIYDLFFGVTLSRHSPSFRCRPEDHIRPPGSTFRLSHF